MDVALIPLTVAFIVWAARHVWIPPYWLLWAGCILAGTAGAFALDLDGWWWYGPANAFVVPLLVTVAELLEAARDYVRVLVVASNKRSAPRPSPFF